MDQSIKREFELHLISHGLSRKTTYLTISRIQKFLRSYSEVNKTNATSWLVDLFNSNGTKATAKQYVLVFRRWCQFVNEDWAYELKTYRDERKIPQTFSNEEVIQFLDIHTSNKWDTFWTLCAYTGCRTGEIKDLTIEQVDIGKKCIILQHTKTNEPRIVPLLPNVLEIVSKYIETLNTQQLFPSPKKDIPMSHNAYIKDFKIRLKQLNIKRPLTPYNFRHTAITRWLNDSNMNIFEVKRVVGHKKTSTTERYYSYGGFDKVLKMMKTDPLVRDTLSTMEQFEQIKKEVKEISVNADKFEREISENGTEITLKVKIKSS